MEPLSALRQFAPAFTTRVPKTIDDAAEKGQKTLDDAQKAAEEKVKGIFTGVDKNKEPTPEQEKQKILDMFRGN